MMKKLRNFVIKRASSSNQLGQATLEFALAMIVLMGFILFYVQLSLVFAWGNYIQYATFMASRAYLSASSSPDDQRVRAKAVIVRTLKRRDNASVDRLPFVASGANEGEDGVKGLAITPPEQFQPYTRSLAWMEGIRYTFKSRLFLIPFLGGSTGASASSLTLTSESWLGREPSYTECVEEMQGRVFDNGC